MIRPGVGYMAMRGGFNKTTYGEFIQAMTDLKKAGMQQLVLDLISPLNQFPVLLQIIFELHGCTL